jgi:hypothetical protein
MSFRGEGKGKVIPVLMKRNIEHLRKRKNSFTRSQPRLGLRWKGWLSLETSPFFVDGRTLITR